MLDNKSVRFSLDSRLRSLNEKITSYNQEVRNALTKQDTKRVAIESKGCNEKFKGQLQEIINDCDKYIESIPLRLRTKQYSKAVAVLAIQKQAVRYFYLPEAKTPAKAYVHLLRDYFFGANRIGDPTVPLGKHMELEYFSEFRYQGDTRIRDWLRREVEKSGKFRSLQEIMQEEPDPSQLPPLYPEDVKANQVSIREGLLYFQNTLLDTEDVYSGIHELCGNVLFVVSPQGELYISDPKEQDLGTEIHHSSFLRGKPALCAGTLAVTQGVITEITLKSGHYTPGRKELLNFLSLLKESQVDLSKILVYEFAGGAREADKYLRMRGFCLPPRQDTKGTTPKAQVLYALAMQENKKEATTRNNVELFRIRIRYLDYLSKASEAGSKQAQLELQKELQEYKDSGIVQGSVNEEFGEKVWENPFLSSVLEWMDAQIQQLDARIQQLEEQDKKESLKKPQVKFGFLPRVTYATIGVLSTLTLIASCLSEAQNQQLFSWLPENIKDNLISGLMANASHVSGNYATYLSAAILGFMAILYYKRDWVAEKINELSDRLPSCRPNR